MTPICPVHSGIHRTGANSAVFSWFHKVKRAFSQNHSGPLKSGKKTIPWSPHMPNGFQGIKIDLGKPGQGYHRPHKVAEIWDFQACFTFMSFLVPIFCNKKKLENGNQKGQKCQLLKWFFHIIPTYTYLCTRVATLLNDFTWINGLHVGLVIHMCYIWIRQLVEGTKIYFSVS